MIEDLCEKYCITPNSNTIKLHKEVYGTGCPHRSVEIHGGDKKTKEYFVKKIKGFMKSGTSSETKPKDTSGIVFTYAVQLTDGTTLTPVSRKQESA